MGHGLWAYYTCILLEKYTWKNVACNFPIRKHQSHPWVVAMLQFYQNSLWSPSLIVLPARVCYQQHKFLSHSDSLLQCISVGNMFQLTTTSTNNYSNRSTPLLHPGTCGATLHFWAHYPSHFSTCPNHTFSLCGVQYQNSHLNFHYGLQTSACSLLSQPPPDLTLFSLTSQLS